MSSAPTEHPPKRIVLDRSSIQVFSPGADAPDMRVDLDDAGAPQALARLSSATRGGADHIEVALPEGEIARGLASDDLGAGTAAAETLGLARDGFLLTVGPADDAGLRPWAAVPCEVIYQTRLFLADCGLPPCEILPPEGLPPFSSPEPGPAAASPAGRRVTALGFGAAATAVAVAAYAFWPAEVSTPVAPATIAIEAAAVETIDEHVEESEAEPSGLSTATFIGAPLHRQVAAPRKAPAVGAIAPPPDPIPSITVSSRSVPETGAIPEHHAPRPSPLGAVPEVEIGTIPVAPSRPVLLAELVRVAAVEALRPNERPVTRDASSPPVDTDPALETATLRPRPRPGIEPTQAEISASISDAVRAANSEALASLRPAPRTGGLVRRANVAAASPSDTTPRTTFSPNPPTLTPGAGAPAQASTRRPAASSLAAVTPAPSKTTAREVVGLSTRDVSLLGVFGSTAHRRALVRLPNGQVRKVRKGDRFEGGRVLAIDTDSMRYSARGRETVLRLPD